MVVITNLQHPEAKPLWDRIPTPRNAEDARAVWVEAGKWFGGERHDLTPREEEEFGRVYAAARARTLRLAFLGRFTPRVN